MASRTPTALVTGASSGIGRSCTRVLAEAGYRVFAGVRSEAAARELENEGQGRVVPVALDVTDAASVAAMRTTIAAQCPYGLDALVNNAGIALGGPIETTPIETFERQFDVNVWGVVRVTQACLELLRDARGRIVNIGSLAGRIGEPLLAPYSASKHALEAISDVLRLELRPWKIAVVLLEPGTIATPIWGKGRQTVEPLLAAMSPRHHELYASSVYRLVDLVAREERSGRSPMLVAKTVLRALRARRPRTRYVVGSDAKAAIWLRRWLPEALFDRLIVRHMGLE